MSIKQSYKAAAESLSIMAVLLLTTLLLFPPKVFSSPLAEVEKSEQYILMRSGSKKNHSMSVVAPKSTYARFFKDRKVKNKVLKSLVNGKEDTLKLLKTSLVDKHIKITATLTANENDQESNIRLTILLPTPSKVHVVMRGLDMTFREFKIHSYEALSRKELSPLVFEQIPTLVELNDRKCVLIIPLPRGGEAQLETVNCDYETDLLDILKNWDWESFAAQLAV